MGKLTINYNLASGNKSLDRAVLEPNHVTYQFIHNVSSGTATATLMQSTDGIHFDNVVNISGDNFVVTLDNTSTSATINAVELHNKYYRIDITASSVVGYLQYIYIV